MRKKPKISIQLEIQTLFDLAHNPYADEYMKVLEKLINDGFYLDFYQSGESRTLIKDLTHFQNLRNTFNL